MCAAFQACVSVLGLTLLATGCTPTLRGTACATDDQCAANEACIDKVCREVGCLDDGDCSTGTCHPQALVCVGQVCAEDGDCDSGAVCVAEVCAPGCGQDGDCLADQRCEPDSGPNGTCVYD